MESSKNIWWGIAIIVIFGAFFIWSGYKPEPKNLQHITVGIQTSPQMALVMVAKDKGFFEQEGLNAELKEFTAGKFALEAFLGGSLDFSISGDVPVALSTLAGNKFVVPAQVVASTKNEIRVVARREVGLDTSEKYFKAKKRKLATSIGGSPEFFTYGFLNKLGVKNDQIEIVSQAPKDMPVALASGAVDAIAVFDPFAYIAEKQLGDQAITFTDGSTYSGLYVIEAKESVRQDPATVEKFLRGLILAEKFTKDHPEEAKAIVVKYTKLDKKTIDGIWGNCDYRVALTPQLLEYLNREDEWARATGKIKADTPKPNFRDVIFDAPLRKIAPDAVGI